MGDYSRMANYYDVIMTSGYYDYKKIVDDLTVNIQQQRILEIGCGTGLILEEIARRQPEISITGLDLTEAMLAIATIRLTPYPNVKLVHDDVMRMVLGQRYELVFSYGGVWFFIDDGEKEPFLVSHIYDKDSDRIGLERLVSHISEGGQLYLGVQGPNIDYSKVISNGMVYSQKLEWLDDGFIKHYSLTSGAKVVMEQTLKLRTYPMAEALRIFAAYGLRARPQATRAGKFLVFDKC